MSVKFQEETVRLATQAPQHHKEHLAHRIGERLTGGNAPNGYLAVCFYDEELLVFHDDTMGRY